MLLFQKGVTLWLSDSPLLFLLRMLLLFLPIHSPLFLHTTCKELMFLMDNESRDRAIWPFCCMVELKKSFELIHGHIIKVESTRKFSFFKILRYNRDDVIVFYPSMLFPTSSERLLWLLLKYPFHEKREGWLWLAFLTMTIQFLIRFLKIRFMILNFLFMFLWHISMKSIKNLQMSHR